MTRSRKALALAACAALLACCSAAATLAWLTDATGTLVNRFSIGKVSVGLAETDTGLDGDGDPLTNSYVMRLGDEGGMEKDPTVTLAAGSADSWLFVRVEKSANADEFVSYALEAGWQRLADAQGSEVPGVFFREAEQSQQEQEFAVLDKNLVMLKPQVTQADLDALAEGDYPTLTITAYAIQRPGLDSAYEAWGELMAAES